MVAAGVHELLVVGGHTALDLVNTVEPRLVVPDRHDHLTDPGALLQWARRVRLLDAEEAERVAASWAASPRAGARALSVSVLVRERLHQALLALLDPAPAPAALSQALEELSAQWRAAASRSELVPAVAQGAAGDQPSQDDAARGVPVVAGPVVRMRTGTAAEHLIPDRLALAAVDLLCSTDLTHLRACPAQDGGCGWMFLDHSRNTSRRWCSMSDCGARAKARRLTERRRARRTGAPTPAPGAHVT